VIGQAFRFGVVGAIATATHFVVAVACVHSLAVDPQLANVAGFLVAFAVSFAGQWRWTFQERAVPLAQALPGYLIVSVAGFLVNALAYHQLLAHASLRFDVALALVLAGVAGMTFVLSRLWVFRDRRRRSESRGSGPR